MQGLEYSDDAINALDAFLECDYVMFVEGDDDVLFWDTILRLNSDLMVDIRPVGGVNELQPYIEKVINGALDCLVAMDADYNRFLDGFVAHKRILCTYGYAIENTLYSAECINSIVRLWSRKDIDCGDDILKWMNAFALSALPLFKLDLYNFKNSLGVDVGGGNCQRFMLGRNSDVVCCEKIQQHVHEILNHHRINVSDIEFQFNAEFSIIHFIRGHFLQSAVLRHINALVKAHGRKASISLDALYAHAIQFLASSFDWSSAEGVFYMAEVDKIQ